MLMALAAGCPEEEADDGSSGSGGGGADPACVNAGVSSGQSEACASCSCEKCAAELTACQDAACQSVLSCGARTGCVGSGCYCGTDPATGMNKSEIQCLMGASGPCMNEIVTASGAVIGTTNGCSSVEMCAGALLSLRMMPENPIYRSNAVSACTRGTPASATAAAVVGMCAAECAQ